MSALRDLRRWLVRLSKRARNWRLRRRARSRGRVVFTDVDGVLRWAVSLPRGTRAVSMTLRELEKARRQTRSN